LDFKNRQAYGQRKPPGAGAAGVEVEDAVFGLDVGGMGVAEDDRGQACGPGGEVQGVEFVQDIEEEAADFHYPVLGQISGPGATIGVAPDRVHWGDLGQVGQDLGVADVAGVDDELDASQGGDGLGAQQAVGVGDNADEMFRHGSRGGEGAE